MSENENIVAGTTAKIFADLADPQTVNNSNNDNWRTALWDALAEAGLTLAWVPEDKGGSGADLADGFEIVGVAGRFAAAIPLADNLLAGWLLARANIACPSEPITVAPVQPGDRVAVNSDGTLSGRVGGISFAQEACHIAVCASDARSTSIALVDQAACRIADGRNLAGDTRNTVTFDRVKPAAFARAPPAFDQTSLMLMGAAVRSIETAGALETILRLSLRYANERVAFERPIGRFQAVQHALARLGGEVAAAMTASGSAADAITRTETFDDAVFLEAAAAKIRCAEAAQEGAAIAHQIHGAIGFTREHILHRFTLRMLAWRDDFGNESHWAAALGSRMASLGSEELWPLVASR